ncbi:MAG TPA: hypothetical protein VN841_21165 [Bryobacteraceae bacterium]|nr:hypothetical protein [Bryobacteraceae bacterium]
MSQVFNVLEVIGVILQIALLLFLLPGGFRKFPLLLVYSALQLVADVAEVAVSHEFGLRAVQYVKLYWSDEVLLDLLLFLMVIVFTYQALEGSPLRAQAGRFLAGVVLIALVAPFVVYYHRTLFSTQWFNGVSQWLNFGGAIMNLGLWTALLSNKKRDPQLVMVSVGLGLAVTGAALYFGLRQFITSNGLRPFAELVGVLTHLLGVFVWCWTFRPTALRQGGAKQPSPAATSSGY